MNAYTLCSALTSQVYTIGADMHEGTDEVAGERGYLQLRSDSFCEDGRNRS